MESTCSAGSSRHTDVVGVKLGQDINHPISVVLLSSCVQMSGQYLKLYQNRSLPIYRSVINMQFDTTQSVLITASLNKLQLHKLG